MRAPRFWDHPPGRAHILSKLLAPLGHLYAYSTARRISVPPVVTPGVPVICVGSINANGTGKTPTVIALVTELQALGLSPHVISRGYGGHLTGPVEVDEKIHKAADTGDGPLLIAAFTRVWMARDRAAAARAAEQAGADVIIMEDGHQSPEIRKDLSLVVVDAVKGFGNGRCIPAGPLREPVQDGLKRADIVLSIGPDEAQYKFRTLWHAQISPPVMEGVLEPLQTGMDWIGTPFLAFAGIGYPERFFATLKALGATLSRTEALEDHQPYTPALLARLEKEATALGAQLVTTEKDAVRLPDDFRRKVVTLPVRLRLTDKAPMMQGFQQLGLCN